VLKDFACSGESHAGTLVKREFRYLMQHALSMEADLSVRFSETLERPPNPLL
jgi:hypothetical protein